VNQSINVQLSHQPIDESWGQSSVISADQSGLTLHLNDNQSYLSAQQGGRAVAAMGVKSCQLSGSYWDLESQWYFFQGFWSHKNQSGVSFAEMDQNSSSQLQHRIKVYNWAKNQIHATQKI